jgi:hypothetical protein
MNTFTTMLISKGLNYDMRNKSQNIGIFPSLPLEKWETSKDTLHLYLQIIGKIKLALMPRKNHWWFITLYVTPRGIETSSIPYGDEDFEIIFDFIDHELIINTSEGQQRKIELNNGLSVAEFYQALFNHLRDLGIEIKIKPLPYLNKSKVPFQADHLHNSYDKEYIHRYWKILLETDTIMKEFSGRFYGKTSPVQLFWHSLDLVVTRFSGRRAPELKNASISDRDAYSHEVISFGFWPGDDEIREAAFYSYTYPSPDGLIKEKLVPQKAFWIERKGSPLALLKYEDLRKEKDPKQALLDFMESAYQAGAKRAGWDLEEFKVKPLQV